MRIFLQNLQGYEKVVIVAMCAAGLLEVAALAWTLFSIFACCCKNLLIHPLPAFASLITFFLALAIGLYGTKHKESIGGKFIFMLLFFINKKKQQQVIQIKRRRVHRQFLTHFLFW